MTAIQPAAITPATTQPAAIGPAAIRTAHDEDLPALVAEFGQESFFQDRLRRQRGGLGELVVAWLDDRPVGVVYLWREPAEEPEILANLAGVPLINHLEVLPAYQRRGLGAALLAEAERLAFSHGHCFVCLGVGVDNPARSLYERLGYDDWGHGLVEFRWEVPGPDGGWIPAGETCHVLMKGVDPAIPGLTAWQPWLPSQAAALLAGCSVPWCVAGGWAIDLHLGRQTREHGDLEIAIPRSRFPTLRAYLTDFDLYDAGGGRLRLLGPDDAPNPDNHQVWICEPGVSLWRMDTFLEPGDEQTWISNRDDRIRVPMTMAIARDTAGIPYLRPEIVLFAKAKHGRDKDDADLAVTLPVLDEPARSWLRGAIELVHPGHRWLSHLG